jgi:hypothetical protein
MLRRDLLPYGKEMERTESGADASERALDLVCVGEHLI